MMLIRHAVLIVMTLAFVPLSHAADSVRKRIPETPQNAQAVAGTYYRGDGRGYNVTLHLQEGGIYTAEWHGCLGKYGEASGTWSLNDRQIVFAPRKEDGTMKGYLNTLEVLKFNGAWILLPDEPRDRELYDKWGVTRSSCFQKRANATRKLLSA